MTVEALAHDLGKASGARFGDHAAASAELLSRAGFGDGASLRLIQRHHRKRDSNDEPNLHLLQLADRIASSQRVDGGSSTAFIPALDYNYLRLTEAYLLHDLSEYFLKFGDDYLEAADRFGFELEGRKAKDWLRYRLSRLKVPAIEGRPKDLRLRVEVLKLLEDGERSAYQVWRGLGEKGVSKDKRFIGRVLEELEAVKALKRDDDKRYSLNMSLALKHSLKEENYKLPSDEKIKEAILEMHSVGFFVDGIAYQTGLPELQIKEVLEDEIG